MADTSLSEVDQNNELSASGSRFSKTGRTLLFVGIAILVSGAVFAALFGWKTIMQSGSVQTQRPPVEVSAMQINLTTVPVSIQAVGSLRAVQEVLLSSEASGLVATIEFEAGQIVEADTLLVQLYDAPERADRDAAIARANLSKVQYQRSLGLSKSGAESKEVVDQRAAEKEQAIAVIKQIDARIQQKQIRAPFTGKLGIRRVDLGQYLHPGESVATLTDSSRLYVDFSVPQQELRRMAEGNVVRVTTDTWPGRVFQATLETIEPRINQETRNISVRALLENADSALQSGMFVNVELILADRIDRLTVPATAIQTTAFGDNVVVVRGDNPTVQGQVEYVRVTAGKRFGDMVEVDGLAVGDVILIEGQMKTPPGTQVVVAELRVQFEKD
ncbi:MAG: efflux RND transporter periplasmic adaptor subunit [Pseudomonadales bacterium]|nr:efflux RND transporter periplasmic adaptor subunit [Pseudomonadales bacterium]